MTTQPSVWHPLVEQWLAHEDRAHPNSGIRRESVAVRDAQEIGDSAYVLVSFEVEHPWPAEEDAAGSGELQTVVMEAVRVREPWAQRDATRSLSRARTDDGRVQLTSHLLGVSRAIAGQVGEHDIDRVELLLEDGGQIPANVVDGWFLAVISASSRIDGLRGLRGGDEAFSAGIERNELAELMPDADFARHAGGSMYFSPLDVRRVVPLIQWERSGNVAVVATSMEQYDDGGIIRLRIDGIRPDDDVLDTWPQVELAIEGRPLASAVTGEYRQADMLALDVGFTPWIPEGTTRIEVTVHGLRDDDGRLDPVELPLLLGSRPGS